MEFITEDDLRAQYTVQPFTKYHVPEETKLTPGARQFIFDRKIAILEDGIIMNKGVPLKDLCADLHTVNGANKVCIKQNSGSPKVLELENKLEILEARMLLLVSEIMSDNNHVAQQILDMSRDLSSLRKYLSMGEEIVLSGCNGTEEKSCLKVNENCFEIMDIYINAPNGKLILMLNFLRSRIREVRIHTSKILSGTEQFTVLDTGVCKIINKISQVICTVAGVDKCEKQKKDGENNIY